METAPPARLRTRTILPSTSQPKSSLLFPRNLFWKSFAVSPHRAVHELFLLPDWDGLFQRIDDPPASLERCAAMCRGPHHQPARFANLQSPQPVHNRNLAHAEVLDRLRTQQL